MQQHLSPYELASCGLFGAAAQLLPTLLHVVHLGHLFMPLYLPLVALAFLARPLPAVRGRTAYGRLDLGRRRP